MGLAKALWVRLLRSDCSNDDRYQVDGERCTDAGFSRYLGFLFFALEEWEMARDLAYFGWAGLEHEF